MDYGHVCVFTFFTWKSIYGLISIVGHGSLELNSPFLLACYITSFDSTSGATWSNNNLSPMTCTGDGFCQTVSIDNFKFSANESGIFVIIDPLLEKDDHIQWTCFYDSNKISYTVEIVLMSTSEQTFTSSAYPFDQKKPETVNGGVIAGIVIGCILFVACIYGIALLVSYAKRKQKFCFSS